MSNVKEIYIEGEAPYNLHDTPDMANRIAFIVSPTSGLHLDWLEELEPRPNEWGGKTAMYRFKIRGCEAVSCKWIDALCRGIVAEGGMIRVRRQHDLEA